MGLVQQDPVVDPDAQALFREARRRERRRRATIAAGVLVFVGALTAVVVARLGAGRPVTGTRARARTPAGGQAAVTVTPRQPTALAVSSTGVLYVVDPARDQILRRLRDGRFAVLAGSGREGFSGDGGPATRAELRLQSGSSVVVSPRGVVYFSDTGNDRVRAVSPNGRIYTVAGSGARIPANRIGPYLTGSRPALRVRLDEPTGLAFGPGGKLYVAAQDIVSLANGTVSYFAGPTSRAYSRQDLLLPGVGDTMLAFDRSGDMFVANFPALSERTAAGRILFLGDGFRSDGQSGALAASPNGAVYEGVGDLGGIFERLTSPHPVPYGHVMSSRGLSPNLIAPQALNRLLNTRPKHNHPNQFAPNNMAVSANGTIYAGTDSGIFSTVSAIVQINPNGHVRLLWASR
ncbi:MAG: hypothetical protein M0T77_12720 [Actinomycetota bacterium]|nr:hypothetical protein [Actinomycetota bacterium]